MDIRYKNAPVLLSANGRLSYSIPVCLLQAGHSVSLVTTDTEAASTGINNHIKDLSENGLNNRQWGQLDIATAFDDDPACQLAIAITGEDAHEKKAAIRQLEKHVPADSIIAINTESIPLSILQQDCESPARLIGLNLLEPAHTTFFFGDHNKRADP